jgi:tetratricopeptide (TPR) repeat protein
MILGSLTGDRRCSEEGRLNRTMSERDDAISEQFYALHLRGEGKFDEEMEIYRKRLALAPLDARTRVQLAVTLSIKGDAAEAFNEGRMAVEAEPDNYGIRVIFVQILLDHRQWSEALTECKELLRMWPDLPASHALIGDAYHGVGDLNAAIGAYESAARLDVRGPRTFDTLGQLYEEAGRLEDAIDVYRRLLGFAPRFRMGRLHLGKALAASGRVVEARQEWRRLLARRDPGGGDRGQPEPAPDEAATLASEYLERDD